MNLTTGVTHMEDPFAGLSDCLVPESAFDEAFDRLEPADRAWIKKNIAQLHAMYAPGGWSACRVEREWSLGLWSRREQKPFDRAAVCFPSTFLASPGLAAAVLPPLAAGVGQCCAVRIGAEDASWDSLLLGSLELAGVEEVYDLDRERFRSWTGDLSGDPGTRIVLLEESLTTEAAVAACGGPVLLPAIERLGIWFEERGQWDLEVIRKAHPRAGLLLGGPEAPDPAAPREQVLDASTEALFQSDCNALYVPTSLFEEAASRCPRVFGPGQEGCWIWPELGSETFLRSSLCLGQSACPKGSSSAGCWENEGRKRA